MNGFETFGRRPDGSPLLNDGRGSKPAPVTVAEIDQFEAMVKANAFCAGLHTGPGAELFRRLLERARQASRGEQAVQHLLREHPECLPAHHRAELMRFVTP